MLSKGAVTVVSMSGNNKKIQIRVLEEKHMNILVETERLLITEMTMDMAMDVHKNSLDEDIVRFVPDEVFKTPEDAAETQ